jgi:hypothetical protein
MKALYPERRIGAQLRFDLPSEIKQAYIPPTLNMTITAGQTHEHAQTVAIAQLINFTYKTTN